MCAASATDDNFTLICGLNSILSFGNSRRNVKFGWRLRLEQCPDVEQVCHRCQQATVENEQLQNDKTHLEKQLSKSREEAERMSNLVKDMEHKWTQVAKDYEKQVP